MPRGIQEQDVWQAADALLLEGARPTIERVRQKIGSGSPNTVSPHLETWFKHLGGRIKDPGAFAAPSDIPDPVLQAAKHFWEVALAETRRDFDDRLREGMAAAVANVEAAKERAGLAEAAAFDAAGKVTRLQGELAERGQLLDQARQELSADRARLEEVRTALATMIVRLEQQEERSGAELAEAKRQLATAVDRADAADRRVAMELERERTARGKAERQIESLQKGLEAGRDREQKLNGQLAAAAAELALERKHLVDLRAAANASASEAANAHRQIANMQKSLDRLAKLVETKRADPSARKRSPKGSARGSA